LTTNSIDAILHIESERDMAEIKRLIEKYHAVLAGAYEGDENEIQDQIEKLAKEVGMTLDEVVEKYDV
jgi:cobalamin biosynthesis Mg chelatase CobN